MTSDDTSALRKKAAAGKPVVDGAAVSPERAISFALSKMAQECLALPVQVSVLEEARRNLADLPEMLEDLSLLAIIEGPGEALGLIALPPVTLSALIEMQTMGLLAKGLSTPRKPTRIDAAMAADYIDAVLGSIEAALICHPAIAWAGGYRYASHLDDPRPLGLLLEDVTFRVWTAELALGMGGERKGGFLMAVPQSGRGAHLQQRAPGAGTGPPSEAEVASDATAWADRLEHAVMSTSAELEAVLRRVTLPLSAVLNFAPGTELPIPEDALERITIEAKGRRKLSHARLGQSRGNRALRLTGAEDAASPPEEPSLPALSAGESPFAAPDPMDGLRDGPFDLAPEPLDLPSNTFDAEPEPLDLSFDAPLPAADLDIYGTPDPEEDLPALRTGT
ncbi:flagellar switch protein FliM [Thioclava dalianensis]|uniref:Flagellar switch protein FliM n=1 Tax=Thioclava dalianensis TaxID=1185766 RepID=A0A074TKW9_9RHOB|nr:FliM/FliN family flagellar motor C-terminal domain-containing protein [Thioclava dalianensis]KEP70795.1 flagellar switch protein FliM [Thioclava dalianensis]SFN10935.1 flagellar motor switch protein FliM [Thioclava dalianensis]